MTNYFWLTGKSGIWSNGGNWIGGVAPKNGANTAVTIAAAGTYTVTINAAYSIGTLTLNAAGATLSIGHADSLTVATPSNLTAGTIAGAGKLTLGGIGNTLANTRIAGTMDVVIAGSASVRYLTVGGAATVENKATVNEENRVTLGDNPGLVASFLNDTTGTYILEGSAGIKLGGSAASHFDNAGTLIKAGGSGTSLIAVDVNDTGSIIVTNGGLAFTGENSTFSGGFEGPGTIAFQGGNQSLNSGARLEVYVVSMSGGDMLSVNTDIAYAGLFTQGSGTTLAIGDGATLTLTAGKTLAGTTSFDGTVSGSGSLSLDGGMQSLSSGGGFQVANLSLLDGDALTLGSGLTYAGTLTQAAGTQLTFTGGTLTLTGTASLAGMLIGNTLALTGGRQSMNAGIDLDMLSTLSLSGGDVLTVGTNIAFSGTLTELAGTTLNLANNATLTLTGTSSLGGTVTGVGSLEFAGGVTTLAKTTTLGGDAGIAAASGSSLNNTGTLIKIGGMATGSSGQPRGGKGKGGVSKVSPSTVNTGKVMVKAGTLEFDSTLMNMNGNTGAISVLKGATLVLGGGGASSASAFSVAAGGTLAFNGANHAFNLGAGAIGGGLHPNTTPITFGGTVNLMRGRLELGSNTVTIGGSFLQSNFAVLDGTGTLMLAGPTTFTNNKIAAMAEVGTGTTVLNGTTTVNGSLALDGGRVLENQGALTWKGGALELGINPDTTAVGGGMIKNDLNATFTINSDGSIDNGVGATGFINAGALTKSVTSGTTTIDVTLTNSGAVSVQTGTLELDGGGASGDGDIAVSSGATLGFGGTQTFDLGADAIGGALTVGGGILEIGAGAVSVAGSFAQSGGSIVDGTGTLTLSAAASFTNSVLESGGGTTTLLGATTVYGNYFAMDGGRILDNQGALTWLAGNFALGVDPYGATAGGATIQNDADATFAIESDGVISRGGGATAFINDGTLTKSVTTGTTFIEVDLANSGAVQIKAGTLDLGGAVSGGGTITIDGGALTVESTMADAQTVVFGAGGGALTLSDPAEFGALISGFTAGDTIDLTGFAFGGSPTLSYTPNGDNTQGVLAITDGALQASLNLFGQYSAAGFQLGQDGGGGTVVTYVTPSPGHLALAAGH